jgi:RNA polymerase sigma-32 factor
MASIDSQETQDANRRFIRASMKAPMLTRESEVELVRRWAEKHDEAALHALVASHTRLVVSVALRFRGYGLPLGDLIQEGNLGLMQATMRFDPAREVRFSTYATWWVRAAIQDFVLRNWSIVRTGTTAAQKALFFNLRRLRGRIEAAAHGPLSQAAKQEIARNLNVPIREVEAMEVRLGARDQSINAPRGERSGLPWQDFLVDARPSPEDVVREMHDSAVQARWLEAALGQLTERERRIIRQRHLSEEVITLDELGRCFGVSKERVRQIENRALEKLRSLVRAQDPRGVAGTRLSY